MSEIRPCPFCGVVPTISGDPDSEEYVRGYCLGFVGCFNEQCPMPQDVVIEPTQKEATAKWNTRPIEDALTARIAELEAEVSRLLTERDDIIMAEARYTASLELAKKDTRIAELEAENDELKERVAMLDVTAVYKSLGEMGYIEQVDRLNARIAELEVENG